MQDLLAGNDGAGGHDASGNPILKDIGPYLKTAIKSSPYLAVSQGWKSWGRMAAGRGEQRVTVERRD